MLRCTVVFTSALKTSALKELRLTMPRHRRYRGKSAVDKLAGEHSAFCQRIRPWRCSPMMRLTGPYASGQCIVQRFGNTGVATDGLISKHTEGGEHRKPDRRIRGHISCSSSSIGRAQVKGYPCGF